MTTAALSELIAAPPGPWALAAIVAWVLSLAITGWRLRDTRDLDEYGATPPPDAPLLSVIVPARDEARGIGRVVSSVLASTWPDFELIVVDDHSTDGTADIARRAASPAGGGLADPRLRVLVPPPLPEGWFGKQWACHQGALAARGELLCFTDADTWHGPELLTRTVNALHARNADLLSVGGTQEMGSFWERVIQPFVFLLLLSRYGGMEHMSRATRPTDKIANGQFILVQRATYSAEGGHEAVRAHVAEDLRFAQEWTSRGRAVHMVRAIGHFSTRMYTSLADLRRGWGKNVFAGGRDSMPLHPALRATFPLVLPIAALLPALPVILLALALAGLLGPGTLWFGVVGSLASLVFWMLIHRGAGHSALWGVTFPLAALMFTAICVEAVVRGSRVQWKGREYRSR